MADGRKYGFTDAFCLADWGSACAVCAHTPTVVVYERLPDGVVRLAYAAELCGVCLWGEAAAADPDEWAEGVTSSACLCGM